MCPLISNFTFTRISWCKWRRKLKKKIANLVCEKLEWMWQILVDFTFKKLDWRRKGALFHLSKLFLSEKVTSLMIKTDLCLVENVKMWLAGPFNVKTPVIFECWFWRESSINKIYPWLTFWICWLFRWNDFNRPTPPPVHPRGHTKSEILFSVPPGVLCVLTH